MKKALSNINQNSNSNIPLIKKLERITLETYDLRFLSHLRELQENSDEDWTWQWMDECIRYPEIHSQLTTKIKSLESEGWKVATLNFDNTTKGIHINMELEKPFK
ncbi:hypothetical protein [Limnovirga soli]|uniref:Uncharacterized protein n=1 Tax=Limnovirga soli TaxID=2656915 RepID=A0A8J8JTZ4_9BACT|nr:hypothetical protein [Limnovirga soli]NNV55024.1 hypothetical protein [Limnovirga soli]